ncbi:Arsenical resistance operon trans-acting repressor ArsD [Vreelandella boliviensis LC1]|nr:Arsenical resistance operon trans-acting repressor ArsD [Halomonas boliviensis LC1]
MCCSTGVCGADVDQQLITFAADLDWLKSQGVTVRRINLSQEPTEFAANPEVNALMQASGGDDLPAVLVNDKLVSRAKYPSREELANWSRVVVKHHETAPQLDTCCTYDTNSNCG